MNTQSDSNAGSGCQTRLVRDYFDEDGAPKKCPKCDSSNFTEKVLGVVDVFQGMGPTCEAEYHCECGELVGFWAYGAWHPDAMREFLANTEVTQPRNEA